MRITLRVIGKTDFEWIKEGLGLYTRRLSHYIPFAVEEIPEPKFPVSATQDFVKEKEGALLLSGLKPSDEVILLDERGSQMRSVEFARYLQDKMARGGRNIVFMIGGPYGFSQAVYDRAEGKISLSKMTFSHQMVRVFFVEQVYRAMTILGGEPYHHE